MEGRVSVGSGYASHSLLCQHWAASGARGGGLHVFTHRHVWRNAAAEEHNYGGSTRKTARFEKMGLVWMLGCSLWRHAGFVAQLFHDYILQHSLCPSSLYVEVSSRRNCISAHFYLLIPSLVIKFSWPVTINKKQTFILLYIFVFSILLLLVYTTVVLSTYILGCNLSYRCYYDFINES